MFIDRHGHICHRNGVYNGCRRRHVDFHVRRKSGLTVSQGIGQAAAFSLAQRGIDKLALADISLANLDQTVSELGQKHPGVELLPLHVDVASESSIEAAISKTVEVFGRIDIAVNNAGIAGPRGLSPDVSSNDWKRLMDVNLHGVWMCGKAEIREMLKQE